MRPLRLFCSINELDHLSEILTNVVGDPASPKRLFGGYPYCYTVWQATDFTDKQFSVGDWFTQDNSGIYNDAWCNSNAVKPVALLPPHSAPLDMKFGLGTDSNMYAALHGSWNRQPTQVIHNHAKT